MSLLSYTDEYCFGSGPYFSVYASNGSTSHLCEIVCTSFSSSCGDSNRAPCSRWANRHLDFGMNVSKITIDRHSPGTRGLDNPSSLPDDSTT